MNPNGQRNLADREFLALKKALGLRPQTFKSDLRLSVPQTRLMADAKHAKRVLEVGCAGGELVLALRLAGVDATGIDESPKAIDHCQLHLDGEYRSDYAQMNYLDVGNLYKKPYDLVILCGTLDTQENPIPLVREAWEAVDVGGQLLISAGKHRFGMGDMRAIVSSLEGIVPFYVDQDDSFLYLTARRADLSNRYLFVTSRAAQAEQCNDVAWDRRHKSGIWNWTRAFQGESRYMEDLGDISDFDLVHVQLSGEMLDYPRRLKKIMHDQQTLVINPDYSLDLWGGFMRYPDLLWHQLDCADALFCQEANTAKFVSHMLNRPCLTMAHPVNIDLIKRSIVPKEQRRDALIIAHRDMRGHLGFYHYDHTDLRRHYSGPNPQGEANSVTLYDQIFHVIHDYMSGTDMLNLMASKKICSDTYSYTTTGRVATELAALGVPSIGYPQLDAQAMCFPETTFEEMDLVGIRNCVERLLEDGIFYDEVSAYARKAVEHYGLEVSKQRFLTMVEEQRDGSWRDDPRLGVPEGTEAHGPDVDSAVGDIETSVGDLPEDRGTGEFVLVQSPSDDDLQRGRILPATGHENHQAVAAV